MLSPKEKAKKVLWSQLRQGRFYGIRFSRDRRIGPWSVDFCAPQLKYVIEIEEVTKSFNPELRQKKAFYLQQSRLTVRRLTPEQVLGDIESLMASIKQEISSISPLARS
jgi:very-short-patch-repair endonuclease